jgi:hypothetical protein
MFQKLAFMMQNNAFLTWACWLYFLAALQLTTCGSPLICHFYGDYNYTKLGLNVQ